VWGIFVSDFQYQNKSKNKRPMAKGEPESGEKSIIALEAVTLEVSGLREAPSKFSIQPMPSSGWKDLLITSLKMSGESHNCPTLQSHHIQLFMFSINC